MRRILLFLIVACGLQVTSRLSLWADDPQRLWVYAPVNFQVTGSTDELHELMKRAKQAGYNGVVITDYKFGRMQDRPERYYENMERTRKLAEELELDLIPCVVPIGYSNSILMNDQNLAAGLPVKQCEFVAQQGQATAVSENLLTGGDFEQGGKNTPTGWNWIDGFNQSTSLDPKEKHSGKFSLRMTNFKQGNEYGNCRLVKTVQLKPWHEYRLSLWVKTEDASPIGDFKVNPLVEGRALNFASLGIQPTQDWTRHQVVFNSLENTEVNLYLGIWGGESGTIWLDDIELEVAGGINLLRRDDLPITVTSEDGKTEFIEGRDFEKWSDPKLGMVPYEGEYSDDHAAPPIRLTANSRIRNGQKLKVSFFHTVIIHDGQVCSTLVNEKLYELLKTQVQNIEKYFRPKFYFMQHDEIRVGGYEQGEQETGKTSGELLAENARRCTEIIREVNPAAEILVWSDMFDPHHNAHKDYYLVRGTLEDSWKGLEPSVAIMNWNGGKAKPSLEFFAERGHHQIIAGYYDGNVTQNFQEWSQAAKGVKGVRGYMYTTWRQNYSQLEAFAKLVKGE